jgi:KilA-N domain
LIRADRFSPGVAGEKRSALINLSAGISADKMTILAYNDQSIEQRDSDGMVNLTQMAKANGKEVHDWARSSATKAYIAELERTTGIPGLDLLIVINGGSNSNGTWAHHLLAIEFGRWISPAFAIWCDQHIHRLVTTGETKLEDNRQFLEVAIAPKPTLRQIDQVGKMMDRRFGKAYGDRLTCQNLKKYYPALMVEAPAPQEMSSLPTTKALLNPRRIAEELGWYHKGGKQSGDAQKVNAELARLGYQESIGGFWSATEKAIAANLVDRKPVETNSRTQKDQLLWSTDVVAILQEHSVAS